MTPLLVLITASLIALVFYKVKTNKYNFPLAARIGMSVMLLFTAMGHFMFPEGMALMIPDIIPYKIALVYLTAVFEVAGAIGLHIRRLRALTGWLLILFFILVLPANIKAAVDQLDYQEATYDGPGINYLWFRIPLQIVFIVWVYLCSIRHPHDKSRLLNNS